MERLRALAGRSDKASITPEEKGEVRAILAKAAPAAWDFDWPDVLHMALVFLGVYAVGRMGAEAVQAGA